MPDVMVRCGLCRSEFNIRGYESGDDVHCRQCDKTFVVQPCLGISGKYKHGIIVFPINTKEGDPHKGRRG